MLKTNLITDSGHYYHISARCLNKEWFHIPLNEVWTIFSNYLFFMKHGFNLEIYSFVLMNNHFHLLVKAPDSNLSSAMNYFMRETSRVISQRSGRINQTYGRPYHPTLIKSELHFKHAYKYVYRNPVEAGITANVEEYKYSTLSSKIGKSHTTIPFVHDFILFEAVEDTLQWLNQNYNSYETKESIRKALKKSTFQFGKDKNRKVNPLENSIV